MTFKPEQIPKFKLLFDQQKNRIRSFEGCEHLELWQDENDECVFFTYSHWRSAESLEHYRHSDLFKGVWKQTKLLFDDRPLTWSTTLVAQGTALG